MNDKPAVLQCALHSVAIQTNDFDRAFHFYRNVLGLRIIREPFDFKGKRQLTWFDAGGCLIELYSVKKGVASRSWSNRSLGTVNIALVTDDLDQMLGWLRRNQIEVLRDPFVPPTGDPMQPRCAFVIGPDGEEILFREPAKPGALVP